MTPERFQSITGNYANHTIAVVGDFCLDRYLEIDPAKQESSLETGLPVHNVVNVRAQPGGAGTILNNLVALGIGTIYPVGLAGEDAEGFELRRALTAQRGVRLDHFSHSAERRTFTYCKPTVVETGRAPRELNRLDIKNWSPTPPALQQRIADAVETLYRSVNAIILLSQVDVPETGVLTSKVLSSLQWINDFEPRLLILGDSRGGLAGFPPVSFKINAAELARLVGNNGALSLEAAKAAAADLARHNRREMFVTMGDQGIIGVSRKGEIEHVPAPAVRGKIDIVGAGDAVMANLAAALVMNATIKEAMEIAMAAASVVIHQLGTTGTASLQQISEVLLGPPAK